MADLGSTKVFGDLTVAGDIRIGGASVIDTINAGDNTAVKLTGNQTVAGVKTFSSTITGSVSGNAATATKLETARTIAGVSFDGTANISLTAANVGAIATTGGTATGNITAPDFIQSSTQSTNAAACTRKDYVDSAIAAGDALQVSKAGDTMTGNLTAPKVLVSGAQGIEANALTRKDYVDAELAKKLNLTGGTLTGNLTAPAVLVSSAQDTSVNALTRKDYVDGQVATRAPTAHTHTVAAITDLRPQDSNATANTLALRDSEADVHARLLRASYPDESRIDGAIAFRVNNSTNNYTRYCSNPSAIRNWMKGHKTDWSVGRRLYIEDPANPMTEYHIPGRAAVITWLSTDGNYRVSTSNGSGAATGDRLRLDSSGNLFATGAIHEAGQRVYSPNNPPPSLTPTQIGNALASMAYDAVGQYAMLWVAVDKGTWLVPGTVVPGSQLRYSTAEGREPANSPPGNWRLHGRTNQGGQWGAWNVSLWQRVS